MDNLEFRLARRDFEDSLEDILEKHPDLRDDPNARTLITQHALQKAQGELNRHGRFVSTARQFAKESVAETKNYLAKSRPVEATVSRRAESEDQGNEEMSNAEYAQFFRGLGQRASKRVLAEPRDNEGDE